MTDPDGDFGRKDFEFKSEPLGAGRTHLYTGDGKGKTTASIGLAMRALGRGLRVYYGQFLKGRTTGESILLSDDFFKGRLEFARYGDERMPCLGAAPEPGDYTRALSGYEIFSEKLRSGRYDLLIADEINVAVHCGLISVNELERLIDARPYGVELVLTGRYARPEIVARADLVTEMVSRRHYFDRGQSSRIGIEE